MHKSKLKETWLEEKGKLKKRFETLTGDDMLFAKAEKEAMLERLQSKLGKSKDELRRIISNL